MVNFTSIRKYAFQLQHNHSGNAHGFLKEINPEYSLEELMLKLKLQHFGHLMRSDDSLGKTPMLGKIEGERRRE